MVTLRQSPFRRLSTRPTNVSRWMQQRRWARVHDVRLVATQQARERVKDRYKHLLEEKAKREGLKGIGELKEAYKNRIQDLRKKAVISGATVTPQQQSQETSQSTSPSEWPAPPPPPSPLQANQQNRQTRPPSRSPGLKTLSSFLDVQKTMELPQKEIEAIWRLRHAHSKQSLCAAVPAPTFSAIYETARKHPQFILPGLPRKQTPDGETPDGVPQEGAPIHFMQWTFPAPDTVTVLFTHLAEYKLRGEYAQPHTNLTHHLELSHPKGLVLCQGTVIPDRGVSVEEGKWLVLCMQKFYNTQKVEEIDAEQDSEVGKQLRKKRRQLIEQFNQGDTNFRMEDLLDQAERVG